MVVCFKPSARQAAGKPYRFGKCVGCITTWAVILKFSSKNYVFWKWEIQTVNFSAGMLISEGFLSGRAQKNSKTVNWYEFPSILRILTIIMSKRKKFTVNSRKTCYIRFKRVEFMVQLQGILSQN